MRVYDRGSAILIEAEVRKQAPFADPELYDPTAIAVTVTDPNDSKKVDSQAMPKSATGKYYYTCQTEPTWAVGTYAVIITQTDGTVTDVTVDYTGFELR